MHFAVLIGRFRALLPLMLLCLAGPGAVALARAEVLIGQSVVQTGPMAANGLLYVQGVRLYLDTVNAAGGVNGQRLKLVTLDDGYDPERCKANTTRLLHTDRVVALLGYAGTGPTMACAPLAEAAGVPLIGPLTGAPELRDGALKQLFHVRASYLDELREAVRNLTAGGITRIAIAYQDDGFGRSGLKSAETALEEFKLKPVVTAAIAPANDYDATEAAKQLAGAEPAAVLLATAGKASVNLIRAYDKTGRKTRFFGLSVVSSNQLISELGALADAVVVSQVVPSPWSLTNEVVRDFRRDALINPKLEINHTTLEGYIAAKVLVEAIRRAGASVTPASIRAGLESMENVNLGGFRVSLSATRRAASTYVDLSLLRSDGRVVQ